MESPPNNIRSLHIFEIVKQYAIPKINMLCNLMLFENEVKAAVR